MHLKVYFQIDLPCTEVIRSIGLRLHVAAPQSSEVWNDSYLKVSITQETFLGLWQVRTLEYGHSIENSNGKSGLHNCNKGSSSVEPWHMWLQSPDPPKSQKMPPGLLFKHQYLILNTRRSHLTISSSYFTLSIYIQIDCLIFSVNKLSMRAKI